MENDVPASFVFVATYRSEHSSSSSPCSCQIGRLKVNIKWQLEVQASFNPSLAVQQTTHNDRSFHA